MTDDKSAKKVKYQEVHVLNAQDGKTYIATSKHSFRSKFGPQSYCIWYIQIKYSRLMKHNALRKSCP